MTTRTPLTAAATRPQADAYLQAWRDLKARSVALIAEERTLRAELLAYFFPTHSEGTNTKELGAGYKLKGGFPLDRKIDPAVLDTLRNAKLGEMRPTLVAMGVIAEGAPLPDEQSVFEALRINADALLRSTPELVVPVYRRLTEEQRKLWDLCLITKPGSASLEIVPPPQDKS